MLIMRASQLGRKLGQLFIAVWVLCQSMLLCAAGISMGANMPASHAHHGFVNSSLDSTSGLTAIDQSAADSSSLTQSDLFHSSHPNHAQPSSHPKNILDGNVIDSVDLSLMGESEMAMTDAETAAPTGDCCETEEPLPSVASLAPVVVLFALFWLIGTLSRRESMPRSWLIPTVGYHHPRYHLVNCSFLN